MTLVKPVILCGGSGTRLWPVSRADYPKQFVDFPKAGKSEHNSLFRYALNRVRVRGEGVKVLPPAIIASANFGYFVEQQVRDAGLTADIFLEPVGRNTAASLTVAALMTEQDDPVLVVLPSDHAIDDIKLNATVEKALPAAEAGNIVLLGIKPTYPETGYGYIRTEGQPSEDAPVKVDAFVEKPSDEKAGEYLAAGNYLWNSGLFILKASTWLKALALCRPDIEAATRAAWGERTEQAGKVTASRTSFLAIPSESVDYAVLEHCAEHGIGLKVISFSGKWTDLGSWKSVFDSIPKNKDGNFTIGSVVSNATEGSMVVSTTRPVVTNGVKNVAVIETADAVLVTDLASCQKVKDVVKVLEEKGMPQATSHSRGYRPWGYYDTILEEPGFKVKKIVVNPGGQLSLQRHQRRSEHWTVVAGVVMVRVGDVEKELRANESVYIPAKEVHRLRNLGTETVSLIEVQVGDYLGEDDIERLEDVYGRS